jgi:hypothetical protein
LCRDFFCEAMALSRSTLSQFFIGALRVRHHADRIADHQPGFTDALAVQREARSIPL